MIAGTGRSFMKVVAHAQTGVLLGAQLMCEHSSDMISEISEAMANHLTVESLLKIMRPHPSFEEALGEALDDLAAKLNK
jgi:dihydrolipoamide dehydrogenase